jgi:hypothetical protein
MFQNLLLPSSFISDNRSQDLLDLLLSFVLISLVTLAFYLSNPYAFHHWFIWPVTLCGVLMGRDAITWMRGYISIFDPIGILGVLGLHFFFLAPMLHVSWEQWLTNVEQPDDWRVWLGAMGAINAVSILCYRFACNLVCPPDVTLQPVKTYWQIRPKQFGIFLLFSLFLTGGLQIWVYFSMGGLFGYIGAFTGPSEALPKGMGVLFMFSESFPILLIFGFVFYSLYYNKNHSWWVLLLVLAVFFILRMFFGGLRGSRSNTVWALFWAVGVIHLWLRRLPKWIFFAGILFILAFIYIYGFYKSVGLDVADVLEGGSALTELEQRTGRTVDLAILGDLARADLQAFLLYRLQREQRDYQYSWGRTYLGALIMLWPWQLWPSWFPPRPVTKVKEGTELQYGAGTFEKDVVGSSRVYGIAGETMFNFGPYAIPIAYLLFGLLVGWVRKLLLTMLPGDSRLLIVPLLINLCFTVMAGDSDNVIFFLFKNGSIPFFIVLLSSSKNYLGHYSVGSMQSNYKERSA